MPGDKNEIGSRPIPDPTLLTTEQLLREIKTLREFLEARIDGTNRVVALVRELYDALPGRMELKVNHLRDLIDEKFRGVSERFNGIDGRFSERDARVVQAAEENKAALAAALQSQNEKAAAQNKNNLDASDKSERGTTKEIDAIKSLISGVQKSSDDKTEDLKTRLTAIESRKDGSKDSFASALAIIGCIVGVLGLLVAIAVVVRMH